MGGELINICLVVYVVITIINFVLMVHVQHWNNDHIHRVFKLRSIYSRALFLSLFHIASTIMILVIWWLLYREIKQNKKYGW